LNPDPSLARNSRSAFSRMIKKVYEVNPLACPKFQGEMRIIAFLVDITPTAKMCLISFLS
jgi:hypothetical protein